MFLSGLNSFLIVQNFPNSAHPNVHPTQCDYLDLKPHDMCAVPYLIFSQLKVTTYNEIIYW